MMFFPVEKFENQLRDLRKAVVRGVCDIPAFRYMEKDLPGAQSPGYDDRNWQDFRVGDTWGGYDVTAWFRAWVPIPPEWRGRKLSLRFLVGPRDGGDSTAETMLYVNGEPLQAIDVWHEEAWLPPEYAVQDCILVALKSWSGVLGVPDRRHFKLAKLQWIDEAAEDFYFRADALVKAAKTLGENDLRRQRLLSVLQQAFLRLDFGRPGSDAFYASICEAGVFLHGEVEALASKLETKPTLTGIGHAHIDMAWLWRLRHSREKVARTFTTALHLMRQYPDYRFMHSTPQAYQFLKEDYPELFARVKDKIRSGEWEITGGMWVEADTNLTSGESLVRQFLLGRQFVRREFGVEMNTLWLPDVFGYSGALPQIVKKSGLKYFLTSKISWSQFNRFPYDTFHWRGIDGTELLTHFITTPEDNSTIYTYNGQLKPAEVQGAWNNYRQKDVNDELLVLFGWGDGGGGPTREMLESARSLRNLPGVPYVSLGKAEDYLNRLEARLSGKNLPVWDGELYLEYHRGTYTSQAANKRLNRQSEILYHNAEWLSALADILLGQTTYPAASLRSGWEKILLNQFHDILPGSSIRQVYEDSREDYAAVRATGEAAVENALHALAGQPTGAPQRLVVFNTLSWPRRGLVELDWSEDLDRRAVLDASGCEMAVQRVTGESGQPRLLVEVTGVPSLGYSSCTLAARATNRQGWEKVIQAAAQVATARTLDQDRSHEDSASLEDLRRPRAVPPSGSPAGNFQYPVLSSPGRQSSQPATRMIVTPDWLENDYYRIELDARGQIVSLWDKLAGRQVLASGSRGNVLQAFEDRPMNFDAWDIDIYYQEKMREVNDLQEAVVEESGPLRGSLRLRWRFGGSTITQRLRIYCGSPRIDFVTQVDWRERQTLLKAAFPVDVRATRATYEIQFGSIERPTHWNTSWDWARFEVPAHRWADLSEGDYGVALLNDCKYGYDVKDNVLRLTLLKSAISPDETADQGAHGFTYSLLPHRGDWRSGGVVRQAYELNVPLLPRLAGALPKGLPPRVEFAAVDAPNMIVETVKQAEDGDGWIVRVYEAHQSRRSQVTLTFGKEIVRAEACNLVEEDSRPADFEGRCLRFPIAPFEIKTFRLWFH